MTTKNSLLFFRKKINEIDKKIVTLLAERKNLVLEIAKSKIQNKQEIRDSEREKKIINKLTSLGKTYNLKPEYITQLFQLIIKESVLTQKKLLKKFNHDNNVINLNFSVLGPKGSFSYIAACQYANYAFQECTIKECLTFKEVIKSVENYQSNYAILPIENTCSGYINETLDLLKDTNLFIIGEINIFINHCLLAIQTITLDKIQNIYSHPQPFKQCSNFIKKFPHWIINYTKSTADAMKIISTLNQENNAALGSEIGSEIYGLKILSKNLANQKKNITKFIVLNRNSVDISQKNINKTTFLFTIKKESKALSHVLSIFKEKKIIIKKLTSLTLNHNLLEKTFYIEIQVNLLSNSMQETLEKIKQFTNSIKILGCYASETLS